MNTGPDTRGEAGVGQLPIDGWSTLAADWRGQASTEIDVEELRREVARQGRRLRWWLGVEVLLTAIAIGMCLWAAFEGSVFSPLGAVAVIVCLLGFQAWSLWIRRRHIRDSGLDARALLGLERDRIRTSLRYWRVNTWLAVALWCVLCGLLLYGLATPGDGGLGASPRQLVASVLVNAPVVLGFSTFAWWWCRRGRKRLEWLQALQAQLDSD